MNRNNDWVHHLSKHPARERALSMKRKFNDVMTSPLRPVYTHTEVFKYKNVVTNAINKINIKMRTIREERKDKAMTKRNRCTA